MNLPKICIHSVSFAYGSQTALDSVGFSVEPGEFISITGPNGSGKSTLLRLLVGSLALQSGQIEIGGCSVSALSAKQRSRLVAFVPQSFEPVFPHKVFDFVMMGRYTYLSRFGRPDKVDRAAVQSALADTKIDHLSDRSLLELSGGERQRVVLAGALAQETPLLVLDEPMTSLDPYHQTEIYSLLRRIRRSRSISIVMVSHDINSAAHFSDRLVGLRNGRVNFIGSAPEFMQENTLNALFGCKFKMISYPDSALNFAAIA